MKLLRIPIALIFALLLFFSIATATFASSAEKLFAEADAAVAAAKRAERSSVRDDNYNKAIKLYNEIAKDYNNDPEGAKALYDMAVIYRTALGKTRNLNTSVETLKRLINVYDQPTNVLKERLTATDAREVKRIVADAKELRPIVAAQLDKQNSKGILYIIIDTLVAATGRISGFSYWFAIVLITVIIKILITPLTKAQLKSMKEMQKVAPLIKQLQEKYKGDQKTIGEKTLDLYKEHGINPAAGCLPLLVQMPILMLLFYMINAYKYQFELHNASFLWIGSGLSHLFSLKLPAFIPASPGAHIYFMAANLSEPDILLVVLYLISMFISMKVTAVDPSQAEQQKIMAIMMPIMFSFIFAGYPSAFLLYWLVLNILQTGQQYLLLRGDSAGGTAATPAVLPPEKPSEPTDKGAKPADKPSGDRARRRRRR
ncbi:MAG: YidC/Oxa1 family membrane protein insertase [Armatimonadota bacterium]